MYMKICVECKTSKPFEEYIWKNAKQGKRHSRCKACMKEYRKKYYENGENLKQRQRVKNRKKSLNAAYKKWKSKQSCRVCKEDSVECLDLHHLDPSKKEYLVSSVINTASKKKIQKELDKCIVLCSNCHRKVHSGRIQLTEEQLVSPGITTVF